MRNGRVLHRNTFKFPGFGSHANIFTMQDRSSLRMEVDLSENSSNFSTIFLRIVIERTIDDGEEDSRYNLLQIFCRIDFV